MTYQVALSFEDGITRFIKCGPNETVADASYKARINIPLDCRDGACGTCKSFCESGKYDGGDYIEDALTDDEADNGFCLPCQMTPKSDLVLQIPTTSDVAKTAAGVFEATLTRIRRLSATTYGFDVTIENRDALAFLPGQYVNVSVPGTDQERSYSFSSGPTADTLSFLIRITDKGVMSSYLRDTAKEGDKLTLTGPMGSFFLRESKRPALLLAGGTGLAPLLSILEKLSGEASEHPVHLIYGVTSDTDLVEVDVLEAYAARIQCFSFDVVVGDPASAAEKKGYVTYHFEPHHLNDGDVDVYLCGPPPMVEGVRRHLANEGITPVNFYYEKFALAVPAAAEDAAARDATVDPAAAPATGTTADATAAAPATGTTADSTEAAATEAPASAPAPASTSAPVPTSDGGYEIGEEHSTFEAEFDARMALELGAMELMMNRLTEGQLAEYRILAELAGTSLGEERFIDAEGFSASNAAFHDFLFASTGNRYLREAYARLEVKGLMDQVLRNGHWVDGAVADDHLELVDAFERGDQEAARRCIVAHNEHAKATMRAAAAPSATDSVSA
jgi:benzoate/toluate 1,2-dioxygenase reductase subunit